MPILNLENPSFISIDNSGRVNSNGTVGVYVADGLFSTLATIYSDQVKTTELPNPVTVGADGTKEIWYDVKVDIREKTSTGVTIRDTLNLDPNASQASVQGFNLAQNGSFEIDSTSDGQPDNWTISPYAGSAIAITNDVVTDGVESLEFNTAGAGSGGGTATSAKFPVTEGTVCSVAWSFYATHATTLNTFKINWYDEDGAASGTPTTTLTMPASGSVPTSWTNYQEEVTVPADATQGEIVLTGIASGGSNLSSKAYFDGISIINNTGIVTLGSTQTLTNKTLTAPTITTPTITSFAGSVITSGTAQATTSGTSIDFTGIPSWAKKITVMIDGVSTDGTGHYLLQIGPTAGVETSGYVSKGIAVDTTTASVPGSTAGFMLTQGMGAATDLIYGTFTIFLLDSSTNTWAGSGNTSMESGATDLAMASSGTKSLAGTLTQLSIVTNAGDTFDAGKINILYEG